MGFTEGTVEFLETADADFTTTMTLGRQAFHRTAHWPHGEFVDPFLVRLGAQEIRSLDVSDYEQATDICDLNDPLPDHLRRQFTAVIDGGTLQSVFNFVQALSNAMELVAPGGTLFVVAPCNNCSGNNFYQYSPDLFFRALSPDNGFEVRRLLVQDRRGWYEVTDPMTVGRRLPFTTHGPARLHVQARRVSVVQPFALRPQQSDYQTLWSAPRDWRDGQPAPTGVRRLVPDWARRARRYAASRRAEFREVHPRSIGQGQNAKRLTRHLTR
jgi:hypothetical protein